MNEDIDKRARVNLSYGNSFVNKIEEDEIKWIVSSEELNTVKKFVVDKSIQIPKSFISFVSEITVGIAEGILTHCKENEISAEEFLNGIIEKKKKKVPNIENPSEVRKVAEKLDLNKSLEWLKENRQNHLGKWIILDGNNFIGSGEDPRPFVEKARKDGVKVPFVNFIEVDSESFTGGWL